MKNLHVFTNKFPFDNSGEDTFLVPEMTILSMNFNIIFYVKNVDISHENIPFDYTICENIFYIKNNKVKLTWGLVMQTFKEILYNPRLLKDPSKLRELMVIHSDNILNAKLFLNYFKTKNFHSSKDLFYTYWFEEWNIILSIAKKMNKIFNDFKLVSRAHNFDVYDYRSKYLKIPFRGTQLSYTDAVYCISNDASTYLKSNNKSHVDKIHFRRLGVNQTKQNDFKIDNDFVIVSCSAMVIQKRIDKIIKVLSKVNRKVVWYHFGDGPLMSFYKSEVKFLKKNIFVKFMGFKSNKFILNFYATNKISLFINLSDYEGIPVSIMEAISFSIPVIATNVGGVSEIVTKESGVLIEKDCNLNQLTTILNDFPNHDIFTSNFRAKVFNFSNNNFNAEKNFNDFSDDLLNLLN